MNERVQRLRQKSLDAHPSISIERAVLLTEFYRENTGKYPQPVLRAKAYHHLCANKTVYIGDEELIVGERGHEPKAAPTYPEIICHSADDLRILDNRAMTSYHISAGDIETFEREVIPFWQGRSLRDQIFDSLPKEWHQAFSAGIFTEFMEQRAPGHTVGDGKIFGKGMLDFKEEIAAAIKDLDPASDPEAAARRDQLDAMDIVADAAILYAERHAEKAAEMASSEADSERQAELERIAEVCRHVPANAPRDFWEALQTYWFAHLGVITELNGWDAYNPGHLDHHLEPFFESGTADGSLERDFAKELLECLWVKFNNHPAPPKVGVTAEESGTYTDFANINLGGVRTDGSDAVSEVSYLLLEVIDEMHLLQPSNNIQLSRKNHDDFLQAALKVIRKGYGFPSIFNSDAVVEELVRQGKTVEDAREGGTSGCVEAGAFGKEAFILTGYFNLPKMLELALHDGVDPRTGAQLGPQTGDPLRISSFDEIFEAWRTQVRHFVDIKYRGNLVFERMFADWAQAPFLSILTDDCISKGRDYNAGGARYNTSYIQGVGIGSLTDSFSVLKHHVYDDESLSMADLVAAIDDDFEGQEALRQRLLNKTPRYGNDDDRADDIMVRCFETYFESVEGRPNLRGGEYHINMLPTTCHVYFGAVMGAMPDGRCAGVPLSEGISPVQGADRQGPTAVFKSAAKMDHLKTGGTLLNMKFSPRLLEGSTGIDMMTSLVRGYFGMDSHHVQFNVVTAETLREAQADPTNHRDLIVRVAGYSDYFCDISRELQEEIIERTEHEGF
ncbi:MAG: glycyl radical protein [Acidobacteria bacterium]|nr:glycyl radical protein [Candidatus Sulfomarinibacter kjeldsenii]